jgi:hypothetical protein
MKKIIISEDLQEFIPIHQQMIICQSEEFIEVLNRLEEIISKMPETYETDNVECRDKIIYLHYFYHNCHWFIAEKDKLPGQHMAFGYANLGDPICAEWGYVSLWEITHGNFPIELDLEWTSKKFKEIKID